MNRSLMEEEERAEYLESHRLLKDYNKTVTQGPTVV